MTINDIPTVWLFLIFVTLVVIVSLFGLYLFKMIDVSPVKCEDHNTIIAILIGVMSVFLGVMISFLVVTAWGIYSKAETDDQKEAQNIHTLYNLVSTLPDTEEIQQLIIDYLEYIIDIEFPAMKNGQIPPEGNILLEEIQLQIYNYIPRGSQQTILYQKCITTIDSVTEFRINRLSISVGGFNSLVAWASIIDSILIIIMSWFLDCSKLFHYLVVMIIAIYIAVGFFVIVQLSNPYRGDNAIPPISFENALTDINNQPLLTITGINI